MGSLSPNHAPVLVVGAGPVGLLTAINLAKLGVKPVILEQGDKIDQSPRAISYQPCAQAELLEADILEDVLKRSVTNDIQSFWVAKERVAVVEKREGGQFFPAGINCSQPALAEIMLKHLSSRYGVQVNFGEKVIAIDQDEHGVTVTSKIRDTEQQTVYTCDWLVGADGARSSVRKLLGIEFAGFSWPKEEFVASNLRYPFRKYGFTATNFLIDPVHWAIIVALDDTDLWRCAFGVEPGLTNDEIRAKIDHHYRHLLPNFDNEKYELVELNKYKVHQRCASAYRKGRCLLAGDAAHVSGFPPLNEFAMLTLVLSNNPVGGLGLTTGILDAGPLGRALGLVAVGRAPESVLDTWATLRRDKWLSYTNSFSIENKRMLQQGGYSADPLGVWKLDDVAKEHHMEKWISTATPDKEEADLALYRSFQDPEAQLQSRMKQWNISIEPTWLAKYEDEEVVKMRLSRRPDVSALDQ